MIEISEYDLETMELAKPVYDAKGRVLLGAGNQIHPKYLERLKDLGITYLIVDDAVSKGITLDEMMDMPKWIDVIKELETVFEAVKQKQTFLVRTIQQIAIKLIEEVKKRKAILLVPSTSVSDDMQVYAHSVNITLIAIQIGRFMQYNEMQIRDLAVGCLLHDIGKAITNDRTEHPEKGFEIIRNVREISLLSAHIAYQHHEKLSGEGFPRKITGGDFLECAQICGIANLYETMISNEGKTAYQAMEDIMVLTDKDYSHSVINALFKSVPSFLPGTKVRLSTKQEAIVTCIDTHIHRPTVRINETEEEIRLDSNPTILIEEELVGTL
ncbi:HD-GYP domain-containing protein [Bacillus sp. FJAT-45350]|uniref:HD-GYP domain-containing protein n=1 Tax=Bacillus sp. FJAT-45350 TaxID=2011014 RepID=UPI00211B78CD|nr:HD domain-containing protein [Bacillus sp. FJAT-45350]